jgi:hypothetical protein
MTSVETINAQHSKNTRAIIQTTKRRSNLLEEIGKMT